MKRGNCKVCNIPLDTEENYSGNKYHLCDDCYDDAFDEDELTDDY